MTMRFAFKRSESVAASVRRIGSACAKRALKCDLNHSAESIHAARKEIKKMRALLRLVKGSLRKARFKKSNEALRKAAWCLAPVRDACVKEKAVKRLAKGKPAGSIRKFQISLVHDARDAQRRFCAKNAGAEVRRILRKQARCFCNITVRHQGWKALEAGIRKTYRAARAGGALAEKEPTPENFHAWRKQVKNLWYYAQLLHPISPEQMCALAGELERLGELLVDDHDLHVLGVAAANKSVDSDLEPEAERLLPLIGPRQRELREEALLLGSQLFADKPALFCERLHRCWKNRKRNMTAPRKQN